MKVLGIDGALGAFSAAVADGDAIVAARSETGNVALERGLGLVAAALADAGLEPAALDRLAVGIGPGGFTGLRIAVAYAKSLAQAWRKPLVGIDSFDVLEYGSGLARVLSVVVGRPGVISARLRDGERSARASGFVADALDAVLEGAGAGPLAVIGAPKDVLDALAERAINVICVAPAVTPAAAAAALAASQRAPSDSVHAVRADYGELPAAKVPRNLAR